MPKVKFLGKKRKYTVEQLQKLHKEADRNGDIPSREKLSAMIEEQGGTIPSGVIPAGETKISRLERLRQDAIYVGDTDSAEKLAEMVAAEIEKEPDGSVIPLSQGLIEALSPIPEPQAPHEGMSLTDGTFPAEGETLDLRAVQDDYDPIEGVTKTPAEATRAVSEALPERTVSEPVPGDANVVNPVVVYDENGPVSVMGQVHIEPAPLNNGKASVNATKMIASKGYNLAEIPAKDGQKVTLFDVKRYKKLLGE